MNDGVVLAGGRDDVAAVLLQGVGRPADRHVVGIGAAAGEDDVAVACIEDSSDLITGRVNGAGGVLPQPVDAGGVAVLPGEVGEHRLNDARINRRRRRMIKVNGHGVSPPPLCVTSIWLARDSIGGGVTSHRSPFDGLRMNGGVVAVRAELVEVGTGRSGYSPAWIRTRPPARTWMLRSWLSSIRIPAKGTASAA